MRFSQINFVSNLLGEIFGKYDICPCPRFFAKQPARKISCLLEYSSKSVEISVGLSCRISWLRNIAFGISAFQIFWFPHLYNLLESASRKQHTCNWISLSNHQLRTEDWGLRTEDSFFFTSYGRPQFHPLRPQKSSKFLINLKNAQSPACRIAQLVPPWFNRGLN